MIRVSIVGSTGYTGGELIRFLMRHPLVKITHLTSESYAGKTISSVHSWLHGRCDIVCEKFMVDAVEKDSDVVFLCLPHGTAFLPAAEILARGKKVIDLSADFRLKDPQQYQQWYKLSHPEPALLKKAVYGLPELHKQKIARAMLVANPGCYATAVILGIGPIVKSSLTGGHPIVADAKSGISGAGKKLNLMYHYSEANENLLAYSVGVHRHLPEIEQELSGISKKAQKITFTPHLVPMTRGILATCYVRLTGKTTIDHIREIYLKFYHRHPFVVVLPLGEFPETKNVSHTNYCHIGMYGDTRTNTVIVISAIDNLVKGASGQAVQNMNIVCGFSETEGLL